MKLVLKNQLRGLSKTEYNTLRQLCQYSKNLYNITLYKVRQHFFANGNYLSKYSNYHLVKTNENYKLLDINIANRIIDEVDHSFKAFFSLSQKARTGHFASEINIPRYRKKDDYFPLHIGVKSFSKFQKYGCLIVPFSKEFKKLYPNTSQIQIPFPKILSEKIITSIRIIPKQSAHFFNVEYIYEQPAEKLTIPKSHALAIDLNVDNLAACINSKNGASFILDGRKIKSINRFWNKEAARLKNIAVKQNLKGITKQIASITCKRDNQISDTICKSARYIINYCIDNEIGKIIVGYNHDFKQNAGFKQNFTQIPFGALRNRLLYLCQRYGLEYIAQEEAFTSKASFLDGDRIPYDADNKKNFSFSGKRSPWGLYKTKTGKTINADVNAAANILKKSKCIHGCYLSEVGRGLIASPKRIRLM